MIPLLTDVSRVFGPANAVLFQRLASSGFGIMAPDFGLITVSSEGSNSFSNPALGGSNTVFAMGDETCLVGRDDGNVYMVTESDFKLLLRIDSHVVKIVLGKNCAWALNEEGSITWFDYQGNFGTVGRVEEVNDIQSHGEVLAALGAFGGLYMIRKNKVIQSSEPDKDRVESIGPIEFRGSGVLVAFRRSLGGLSDIHPENRVECWDIDRGLIHISEVDHAVTCMKSTSQGIYLGGASGRLTFLAEGGEENRKFFVDSQEIKQIHVFNNTLIIGSWFHIYGVESGEISWKFEMDGIATNFSDTPDKRVLAACRDPQSDKISIYSFDPNGVTRDDNHENYDVIVTEEHESQDLEIEGRFEHEPGEKSAILSEMNEEVVSIELEEEKIDLLVELSTAAKKINLPPVAEAGDDMTIKSDEDGVAVVVLDGASSYDPDGRISKWEWIDANERVVGKTASIKVKIGVGTHPFRLRVTDDKGSSAEAMITVRVT